MINRFNVAKGKDKLKIGKLIKKQIDNSHKMVTRSCVKADDELVFKKILKKEIDSKKFRDYEEELQNLFMLTFRQPIYTAGWGIHATYHLPRGYLEVYQGNWNTIIKLIRPTVESFNRLGKKYPFSKLAREIRNQFVYNSSNYLKAQTSVETVVSELANELGKHLLDIDDIFAMAVLSIANILNQPVLLKQALDKLSEYEISSDAIGIIREMKDNETIFACFLEGVYEFSRMEKFWRIMLLCYENKTQAVEKLSVTVSWDKISLEMKTFLLENGFSSPLNNRDDL